MSIAHSCITMSLLCASAVAQTTQLASTSSTGQLGNANSEVPLISADGRYVLFRSVATNLSPADANPMHDAYLRDMQTGVTELISVSSTGAHAIGFNLATGLSDDARFACFNSNAPDLVPGDPGNDVDVFVRDRQTATTRIVSVSSAGVHGNDASEIGTLSPDGRFVAFRSRASNLVAGDTNNEWDVFVHDLQTGVTERVNLGPGNAQAHGDSYVTSMSFDGRFVLFSSLATDLVSPDVNNERDVFVRDRLSGTTRRVSVDSSGAQSNGDNHAGFLSADGRFATFVSVGTNLVAGDTNGAQDVFVHELATGITTRVSVDSSGVQSNRFSTGHGISADGRFVTMSSLGALVPGDGGLADAFIHDRLSGQTTRYGLSGAGAAPNGHTYGGGLSPDGRFVAFYSFASNFGPSFPGVSQVYVRDRGPTSPFGTVCTGDFGTACPCGNTSVSGANEGCLNSLGLGGKLVGGGVASLAADTFVLSGSRMPNSTCLYFQGTALANGGLGSVFGDGLRCAVGTIVRLRTTTNVAGASQFPTSGDPAVSVRGAVAAPGSRSYQAWYRNVASFCTASPFNLTNGVWVVWTM